MSNEHWLSGAPKHAAVIALMVLATAGFGFSVLAPRVPPGMRPGMNSAAAVKIDLNTASAAELEALPRIGPSLARRIVEDRAAKGPFRTVEELDRVKGVGKRTVELLRPFATAGGGGQ